MMIPIFILALLCHDAYSNYTESSMSRMNDCVLEPRLRVGCGTRGITQKQCEELSCCYHPLNLPNVPDCFEIKGASDKCPEFVKVMGTNTKFDGIYKKSSRTENRHPVYFGPGDTIISWANNYWWITSISNIGESNGYAYLDVPMDCPGDAFSILRRGGSDKRLPGEKLEAINDLDVKRCEELNMEFPFLQKNNHLTGCWKAVQPIFRIYSFYETRGWDWSGFFPYLKTTKHKIPPYIIANNERDFDNPIIQVKDGITLEIKKMAVLFHGFTGHAKGWSTWVHPMAEKLIDDGDVDAVLTVEWVKGHYHGIIPDYHRAAANAPYIGAATSKLLSNIRRNLPQEKRKDCHYSNPHYALLCNQPEQINRHIEVHCLGHSLGAHPCGFLGKYIKADSTINEKITLEKITAMDPAGPLFYTEYRFPLKPTPFDVPAPVFEKLHKTDANLLQVIHTDQHAMGTGEHIGHIDFFVGQSEQTLGSALQYGCSKKEEFTAFDSVSHGCSHGKAWKVVMNSITNKEAYRAHVLCNNVNGKRGCSIPKNCSFCKKDSNCVEKPYVQGNFQFPISKKVIMGYWWSGEDQGSYGVLDPYCKA